MIPMALMALPRPAWTASGPAGTSASDTVARGSTAARSTPRALGQHESPTARKKRKGRVTIATLGPRPISVSSDVKPQAIVERIIAHWRAEFAKVLPDRPDLIVVPEACDRPGGMSWQRQVEYYRVRKNQVRDFFAQVARDNHCYMVYSAKREMPDGSYRNSSVLIDRNGKIVGIYNKNHPTIGEIDDGVLCGKDAPVFDCDFGRVALAICFDLNFDQLRTQYAAAHPDLIVFSSMYHGGMMQAYWAYSCRCHFVGAIAGQATPSQILDPLGRVIASNTNYFDSVVATVNLDCAVVHLDGNWGKLRAMKAKYGRDVRITDPGLLGAVLIASNSASVSIARMIDEFQVERLDHYFTRSLQHRLEPGNMEP